MEPAEQAAAVGHGDFIRGGRSSMLWGLAVAAVMIGQPQKAEKPTALDPVTQGQVYAAYRDARSWSFRLANQLCSRNPMIPMRTSPRQKSESMYNYTIYSLEAGAAKQICEAYGISRKTLARVVSDPRSRDIDFVPEPKVGEEPKRPTIMAAGSNRRTRFDPGRVVLSPAIARRIGYKNPIPPDPNAPPPPPSHPDSYTNDGRLIPGRPADPEIERRKKEIEERAAATVVKEPIPASP